MATKNKTSPFHKSHDHRPYIFPPNFLWGSATSSHQVEGNNKNDWTEFEKQKGKITHNEKSKLSTNHYNLFEHDFDSLQEMNQNAYRFSIEWSRIEPQNGKINKAEVIHYEKVLNSLKKRGIKIMLTLHHFTNPIWFSKLGGWSNSKSVYYFERYVEFIVEKFGKYVDFWITINEPMVFISMGYIEGLWPPCKKNPLQAYLVLKNLIKAHKKTYTQIHLLDTKTTKQKVGIAKNIISFEAQNKNSLLDTLYTFQVNHFWNHYFFTKTKGFHDFIGMNYYFHQRIERKKGTLFSFSFSSQIAKQRRELNDLGWEIYPSGIFSALMDIKKYNLPIYITENGIATRNDNKRIRYILTYLTEINRAINAGANVKGYFYWSLLDNFEWHLGFTPRFGLIDVNYKTFERQIKKSGKIFAQIAKTNQIEHDLLQYIGHTPHNSKPDICERFDKMQNQNK